MTSSHSPNLATRPPSFISPQFRHFHLSFSRSKPVVVDHFLITITTPSLPFCACLVQRAKRFVRVRLEWEGLSLVREIGFDIGFWHGRVRRLWVWKASYVMFLITSCMLFFFLFFFIFQSHHLRAVRKWL